MLNASGVRTSLLNSKIHSITRPHYQDPTMGWNKRRKIGFSPKEVQAVGQASRTIVVLYIIDIVRHLPCHDALMMQQLSTILINKNISFTKVLFKNHNLDKANFNRIYNLIRLNIPDAVIDVLPDENKDIYDYISKLGDDDNHYITFHPYIESMDLLDLLFENTILNFQEYLAYVESFEQDNNMKTTLILGLFKDKTYAKIHFDYAWITTSHSDKETIGHQKIFQSIFEFDNQWEPHSDQDFDKFEFFRKS